MEEWYGCAMIVVEVVVSAVRPSDVVSLARNTYVAFTPATGTTQVSEQLAARQLVVSPSSANSPSLSIAPVYVACASRKMDSLGCAVDLSTVIVRPKGLDAGVGLGSGVGEGVGDGAGAGVGAGAAIRDSIVFPGGEIPAHTLAIGAILGQGDIVANLRPAAALK